MCNALRALNLNTILSKPDSNNSIRVRFEFLEFCRHRHNPSMLYQIKMEWVFLSKARPLLQEVLVFTKDDYPFALQTIKSQALIFIAKIFIYFD